MGIDYPLVSAIIPAYNDGKYLINSVESVLAQKYEPLECIVVDDGSTDDTAELVKRWENIVHFQCLRIENRGLSFARNVGIRACRGDLVAFLDADDWWHPEKTSVQVEFMLLNPGIGFCWCDVILVNESYKERRIVKGGMPENIDLAKHVLINGLSRAQAPSTWMVRYSLLRDCGGFDESIRHGEDRELFFRLACNARGGHTDGVMVNRLVRRDSLSQNADERIKVGPGVLKKMLGYAPELWGRYRSTAMHNLYVYLAGHAWTHEAWYLSFSRTLRAAYWKPSYVLSRQFWDNFLIAHVMRICETIKRKGKMVIFPKRQHP